MILRGIHVEHWRCIARLDLEELPLGILVLHGPNRTGKSSLAKALRGCLFDLEHDTTKAELKNSIPWNGTGPPKLAVEFETGKERYRLTKIFAKTKEGLARLEQKRGEHWRVAEDSPREASRKTQELLGTTRSSGGLNQLLWLEQGEISLPEAGKLESSLEQRLVSVLGVLVTGADLLFQQALQKRYDLWFGVKGSHKPSSPVHHWEKQLAERRSKLAEQQAKFREVEQALGDLEACESRLPLHEKAARQARRELEALQQEREHSLQRRQQYHQALRDCQAARQQVQAAQKALHQYQDAKSRWQTAEEETVRAEASHRLVQEERNRLTEEHAKKAWELESARLAEETHQDDRDRIEDCRKLFALAQQQAHLEESLRRGGQVQQILAELEHKLPDLTAPEDALLKALRENRREAGKLRAQLQAAALTLTVTLHQATPLQLRLDGSPAQPVDLAPQQRQTWPVRQRARVEFPGIGAVEIARSQENLDLERAAQKLAKLDRDYRDTVTAFHEQPDEEACLDRLAERRLEREAVLAKLAQARQDSLQVAPHGLENLERDRAKLENQQQLLLARRPELVEWQPSDEDVSHRERLFQSHAVALQRARKELEKADKQAADQVRQAEVRVREQREKLVALRTTARNALHEMQRFGDEFSLQAALRQAEEVRAAAQHRLGEVQLTEAEQTIEQRCQDAESAWRRREERLQQLKEETNRHRGRLEGSEGLHLRLADAEAAVQQAETALARENLEAAAHKRLRDLFEQCRDTQVHEVMGPIAARVLEWAHFLGLREYREVRFGDRFLPESLLVHDAADRAPGLADESYGTQEQLSLLVRLALGGVLAREEPAVAILDDPLAHADPIKHRRILDVLRLAADGNLSWNPPAGRLQILILTCHPERFDYLPGAYHIDLAKLITREL